MDSLEPAALRFIIARVCWLFHSFKLSNWSGAPSPALDARRADRWLFREFFDSWWPLLKSRFLSFGNVGIIDLAPFDPHGAKQ